MKVFFGIVAIVSGLAIPTTILATPGAVFENDQPGLPISIAVCLVSFVVWFTISRIEKRS